jgi:hypothetical protein
MSVNTETLEKLKVQLKAQKDLGTPINGDLYSHLFEVFNRIILHHQKDGFDKFEDISAFVKYHNFKISDPDQDIDVNGQAAAPPSAAQLVAYLDKFRDLLAEKPDMVAPEDKGLVATEVTCGMPDFPSHAAILAQAGVGFGEDASLMIQKSLRRLAKVSGAKTLKLFGKILGTSADYWVAQGTLPNADEPLKSVE